MTNPNLQDLSERINRIDDLVSKGATLKAAIQIVDLTEQQIRDALNITSRQLTLPAIKKALAKALGNNARVTPLEEKLARTQRQVDQNTADIAKGKQRLGLGDKRYKGTERRINQLNHLTKVLGERLAETHDLAVKGNAGITEEQVNALVAKALEKGKAGGRKSFMQTLLDAGVDRDTLAKALTIVNLDDETDLADNELFTEFLTAFIALKSKVDDHEERLHLADTRLDAHDEEFRTIRPALYAYVDQTGAEHAHHVNDAHRRIDSASTEMGFTRFSIAAAVFAFAITWFGFVFGWFGIPLSGTANLGNRHGSLHGGLHHAGVFGFGLGLLVAAIILAIGRTVSVRFDRRHPMPAPAQPRVNDDVDEAPTNGQQAVSHDAQDDNRSLVGRVFHRQPQPTHS